MLEIKGRHLVDIAERIVHFIFKCEKGYTANKSMHQLSIILMIIINAQLFCSPPNQRFNSSCENSINCENSMNR
jgi:hypothetical protein